MGQLLARTRWGSCWPGSDSAHLAARTDAGSARAAPLLERGYAIHELTFAALFIVLLAIPFRRRRRWAWWACWLLMIATFGAHDPTTLTRSLIVDLALPVLLLAHLPAFFGRARIIDIDSASDQEAPPRQAER